MWSSKAIWVVVEIKDHLKNKNKVPVGRGGDGISDHDHSLILWR